MITESKDENSLIIKFGGGQNSSASEDDVADREASEGENFALDLRNRNLRNRKPFDLLGTAPNEAEIRGFATLQKRDGTITLLVQAGDTVYTWSAAGGFDSVGTVDADARLRGRFEHYWQLDDLVIITDLALQDVVMTWDGTTLADMTHNLGGTFKAKYCTVASERAIYGNVDAGTATPHMAVFSKVSDYNNLSTADKPTTAIGESDPFFLLTLDLRPINGLEQAFGVTVLSTEGGDIMRLTGSTSQNFLFEGFAPRTGATGDESVRFIGNDIVYGRLGRVESVSATDGYGDVEQNDLSLEIKDAVETFANWTIIYNTRTQNVFCYPENNQIWLYKKSMQGSGVSPWCKNTTNADFGLVITAMMNALDPTDGLEYIFFGDGDGNLYRLEGTGEGDAGETPVVTRWRSRLYSLPDTFAGQNFQGYVKHKIIGLETITIRILQGGSMVLDNEITVDLVDPGLSSYFGGDAYFGGDFYFGNPFSGRFARKPFLMPGFAEDIQVEVEYAGTGNIEINEIGLIFESAD